MYTPCVFAAVLSEALLFFSINIFLIFSVGGFKILFRFLQCIYKPLNLDLDEPFGDGCDLTTLLVVENVYKHKKWYTYTSCCIDFEWSYSFFVNMWSYECCLENASLIFIS